MSRRRVLIDWQETEPGRLRYAAAKLRAQRHANETGFDFGVEANDFERDYRVFMLPRRENRYGFELRCEVVSCSDLSKCQEGHGPR